MTLRTTYERIPVTTLASGHDLFIPLHRLQGAASGPTLGLSAVVHGDEPLTNEVVRRVLTEIDPAELRGTILAVPIGNPLAFEALTRHTPQDQLDLNRNFPGAPAGWLSEQMAHVLSTRFVSQLDVHIDLHTGGVYPTVDYVYIFDRSRELSLAFGSRYLFEPSTPYQGTFAVPAAQKGIPFFTAELGGGSFLDGHYIEHGVRGVRNVLKQLGMLQGDVERPIEQTIVTEMAVIRPRLGGMLHPQIGLEQLGKEVAGGTLLGRVISPYTFETLEEIRAPFDRGVMILLRGGMMRVQPGDYGYMVANLDSARPAR
ncbi:MAG TPA: succinylglutamate desuccinylase/aspartoacylase family protein [Chloroflexota bacterium]|nr:succinylglutamate desuccinylase/aspartoacylase family protein [Chloroflexota bacterium]